MLEHEYNDFLLECDQVLYCGAFEYDTTIREG